MKTKLNWLLAVAVTGVMAGCAKDDNNEPENYPIILGSSVEMGILPSRTVQTRIQDTEINPGRTLSLFVTNTGDLLNPLYDNETITATSDNGFTHSPMYYPMSGNKVDFYSVHPYAAAASLGSELSFTIIPDQTTEAGYLNSDLLYAKVEGVSRTKNKVNLGFTHKLSKLDFTIKKGVGAELTNLSDITISSLKPTVGIDLTNGTLSGATGTATDIRVNGVSGANEAEISGMTAIIVPQTVPSGTKLFKITIGPIDYYYTTSEELTFLEGKRYILELTINQTGIVLSSSIVNWGTGSTIIGNGEAEDETN